MNKRLIAFVTVAVLLPPFLLSFEVAYSGSIKESGSASNYVTSRTHYPWSMFHYDPQHTGYTSSPGPETNQTFWIYETDYSIWGPSPTVCDGILYMGGGFGPYMYALNASTGEQMWNYTTGYWIASTPAVVDGVLYFGAYDQNITAIDAGTGAVIWNYTTDGWLAASSPAVVDDVVYIGGGYGNSMYALNATTGDFIWKETTGDAVHSSPAVADGIVYVGSYDDSVHAFNASNGDVVWQFPTQNDIFSSPAVVDGIVYIGSNDNTVYALNATDGTSIWNYTTGYWVVSSPAVANGVVYVGSYDQNVYALSATTGAKIWNYTTGGAVSSSPAIAGDLLYIGSGDNKTYALNATTGAKIWSYATDGDVWASPAVADGVVYVASTSERSKIYAVGYPPRWPEVSFTYSPESIFENEPVTFNASESFDPDGYIVSYTWDFGDGNVTITPDPIIDHEYSVASIYTVSLTVTDNDSLTETAWRTVKVGGFPVAKFTYAPEVPFVNDKVTFNASESYDRNGTIESYEWDFGDGNVTVTAEPVIDHTYTAAGTYTANLTVTDNDALTSSISAQITVGKDPVADFTWSPEEPLVGETLTLDASLSTPEGGTIVQYKWDFGDDSPQVTEDDPVTTHVYSASGTYNVTLTIRDSEGLEDSVTQSITVGKVSSEISIALSSAKINVGENVTISGSITPLRAGASVTIQYRLAGGNWDTLATVTSESNGEYSDLWAPSEAGDYELQAQWLGDANTLGSESSVVTLTVEEAPAPPLMQYAVLAALIIIAAGIAIYFLKFRRKQHT